MKPEKISDALDMLDDDLLEQTEKIRNKERRLPTNRLKWVMVAVFVFLVIIAEPLLSNIGNKNLLDADYEGGNIQKENPSNVTDSIAYGFKLNGAVYFPISFEERVRYGLVEEGAVGLTAENGYQITEADLGGKMGYVEDSKEKSLIGCQVYHFASFPENDAICIVAEKNKYAFYVAGGLELPDEIGQNFNKILEAYNMPESIIKLEIQTGDWQTICAITDKEEISAVCTLLANKENIGIKAKEQRFAQLWQHTYGNENVSYNGDTMTYTEDSDYEKAHALWSKDERIIWVNTARGFRFYIPYTPSIQTFECHGYYLLSEEELIQMNALLAIE